MAKTAKTSEPTITRELTPEQATCPHCGHAARADYANRRTVHTLAGVLRLNLTIRRCHLPACVADKKPYRPEAEGSVVLLRHEFGLDVIALVGRLRYSEHRSVPESRGKRRPSPCAVAAANRFNSATAVSRGKRRGVHVVRRVEAASIRPRR